MESTAHIKAARRKTLLYIKNTAAFLQFDELHVDKPEGCWENILWTDETKKALFGLNVTHYVWTKKNTIFE